MRDEFFDFRPAVTGPGEIPTEDRHRPGDPDPGALESLAQPAQSRHAAAGRPWSMHTQDERWSPVEPDVQVELAADVLPRPGRRDLIEQRGNRRVIGAGSWPEPAGKWWTWCQSVHPSSRGFAGSIPTAGLVRAGRITSPSTSPYLQKRRRAGREGESGTARRAAASIVGRGGVRHGRNRRTWAALREADPSS